MAGSGHEFSGKSVEDAIDEGLLRLNLQRDQVEIEILTKGSRGIFGIGSEPARVRLTPHTLPATDKGSTAVKVDKPSETVQLLEPDTEEQREDVSAASDVAAPIGAPAASEELDLTASLATPGLESTPVEAIPDDEMATLATDLLRKMLHLMGFEAAVSASWQMPDEGDDDPYLLLDITGNDLGALIGRRGETLNSIQYLIRLMINQRVRQWKNIVVDVEKYKERRVTQLTQLAERMALQVTESGRAVSLEPMPANERRIVHLALRDHPEVYTQSSGEGDRRKVHIVAKDL